jgi:hypothetical protein
MIPGRARVLFIGEVAATNQLFLDWIKVEPKFLLTTVPCDLEWVSLKEAKRFARMYLPRSEARLREEQDVMVFEDFSPSVLPLSFLEWGRSAIRDGMGIALIEFAYWGGTNEIQMWMTMEFYGVFPAETVVNLHPAEAGRTFYRVENEDGPLDLPGIESTPMNSGYHGDLKPRAGAVVEATWRGRGTPAMVTSTYGEGNTLQLDHGWDNIPGEIRLTYEYLPDYIFNQIFSIAGIPFPEDLLTVHATRASLLAYSDRKRGSIAVIEFVERFGADYSRVEEHLNSMDERYDEASVLYLNGEYERAGDLLFELLDEFTDVESELIEAKDRAFLWIYIAEWTSVLGVGIICGVSLWTLMVRRRLFRDVDTTSYYGGR